MLQSPWSNKILTAVRTISFAGLRVLFGKPQPTFAYRIVGYTNSSPDVVVGSPKRLVRLVCALRPRFSVAPCNDSR